MFFSSIFFLNCIQNRMQKPTTQQLSIQVKRLTKLKSRENEFRSYRIFEREKERARKVGMKNFFLSELNILVMCDFFEPGIRVFTFFNNSKNLNCIRALCFF